MENWSIAKAATVTDIAMCFNEYRVRTVGLYACINVRVKLRDVFVNPDFMIMIGKGRNNQCKPDFENDFFDGPPNFVMDIHTDLNSDFIKERKALYESAGVQEYLIVHENLEFVQWNRLEKSKLFGKKKFQEIQPDENGIIKSSSLPGLWIPIEAMKKRNNWLVMASIEHGLTRREHHELMDSIWKNK
ncbi:MAG TPA: Uma2 family endonuclease [Flavobacteriaceae bacterium]|nr:Uma2 family endonuclease [Flavobacteriaceae bacterium]